jgi:hypothetical protein
MGGEITKINLKLIEVLSQEKGYFGRVDTWGQRPTKYEYIGYELTEDFLPTLEKMPDEQQRNLTMIIMHFELHAQPLKSILKAEEGEHTLYTFYSEIAWSQFMTVVMFGMLELAIKGKRNGWLEFKRQKIVKFMEDNLPTETKDDIAKRYKIKEVFKYKKQIRTFSDVIDHLWYAVRSGFIHDGGIESRGMEWSSLKGFGSKDDPMTISHDVPMQELLQITWQAILNSFGYKGELKLPKYKQ